VYRIERLGSTSGKATGRAVISRAGELPVHWRPKQMAPEPPGPDPYIEEEEG